MKLKRTAKPDLVSFIDNKEETQMVWDKYLRPRNSIWSVVLFGITTFTFGGCVGLVWFNWIQNEAKPSSLFERNLLVFAMPFTLGVLGFTNSRISEEVEEELDKQEQELKNQISEQVQNAVELSDKRLKRDIEEIIEEVRSSEFPEQSRTKINKSISEIRSRTSKIILLREESHKIAQWLDEKDQLNKYALRDAALNAASIQDLQPSLKLAFDKDICGCIDWLQDSLIELHTFLVDKNEYASALMLKIPSGFVKYKDALEAMVSRVRKEPKLQSLTSGISVLEEMTSYLIGEIEKISEEVSQSQ